MVKRDHIYTLYIRNSHQARWETRPDALVPCIKGGKDHACALVPHGKLCRHLHKFHHTNVCLNVAEWSWDLQSRILPTTTKKEGQDRARKMDREGPGI